MVRCRKLPTALPTCPRPSFASRRQGMGSRLSPPLLLVARCSRALHFSHLIGRKTGSSKRPVVSASRSHSWRCGKRVTARSCERAGAAWKLTRTWRQGTVELRVPSNATSLVSGAHITSRHNHSTATSESAATNYAICFSSRRHRRKQCFSNSKVEKGPQLPETEITHHGVAACHSQNFIKLAPVNTDNRTQLGMTFGENSDTCTHVFYSKWWTSLPLHFQHRPSCWFHSVLSRIRSSFPGPLPWTGI